MRILLSFLCLSFVFFACGRDTTGVDGNPTTTAAAPAAAVVPGDKLSDGKTLARPDETGAERIGRDQMAPVESMAEGTASPADVARYSGARNAESAAGESSVRRATGGNDAAPKQMNNAANNKIVTISDITAPVLFTVSKTPCKGDCKLYSVTLHNDGTAVLNARKNVGREGYFTTALSTIEAGKLSDLFRRATGSGLSTVYPAGETMPADLPATKLEYPGANNLPQTVRVYSDAPADLQRLFDEAEKLAEKGDWIQAIK